MESARNCLKDVLIAPGPRVDEEIGRERQKCHEFDETIRRGKLLGQAWLGMEGKRSYALTLVGNSTAENMHAVSR